jgi:hypothetical protein
VEGCPSRLAACHLYSGRHFLMPYRAVDVEPDDGDLATGTRWCRVCKERKPMDKFHWTADKKYRRRICSKCVTAKAATRRAERDPIEQRLRAYIRHLRRKYGISFESYQLLMELQGSRCAICRMSFDASIRRLIPHVDHDHVTSEIRGLLCFSCNTAIGKLRDNQETLAAAISYLQATPPNLPRIPQLLNPEERSEIARLRRPKGQTAARRKLHGETNRMYARLVVTDEQAVEIQRRYADGRVTQQGLADEYGCSQRLVSQIVLRKGRFQ